MPCPSLSFSFTLLSHSCLLFPPLSFPFFPLVFLLAAYFLFLSFLLSQPPVYLTILMLIHNLSAHRSSFSSFSFSPHLQLHSFTLFPYLILSILSYRSDSAPSFRHLSFPLPIFPSGSRVATCLFEPPPLCVPSLPSSASQTVYLVFCPAAGCLSSARSRASPSSRSICCSGCVAPVWPSRRSCTRLTLWTGWTGNTETSSAIAPLPLRPRCPTV